LKSIGIRFSNRKNRAFTADLKSAVNAYFKEEGVSRNANLTVYIKTAVMLTLIFGPYALIMAGALPLWAMWLSCFAMGAGVAGFGFGVMHDAMHGSYSSNPRVNRTLGFILDVLGGSSYLWDLRHNKMHHTYTNIYGADVDLEPSWVLRFSPHSKVPPHPPVPVHLRVLCLQPGNAAVGLCQGLPQHAEQEPRPLPRHPA
jgi:linoleoyl-CoA desaturase